MLKNQNYSERRLDEIRFSVVVVFRNAEKTLAACLNTIAKQKYPEELREVILVDNQSTDSSASIAKAYPQFDLIYEPVANAARARNTGIDHGTFEYVAFIDSDCEASPVWLKNLAQRLSQSDAPLACGGPIEAVPPNSITERYAAFRKYHDNERNLTTFTGFLPFLDTANAVFHRSLFNKVGLFDEWLSRVEDRDFSWRCCAMGTQLALAPRATVLHKERDSFRGLLKQSAGWGAASFRLEKKIFPLYQMVQRPNRLSWSRIKHTDGAPLIFKLLDIPVRWARNFGYFSEMFRRHHAPPSMPVQPLTKLPVYYRWSENSKHFFVNFRTQNGFEISAMGFFILEQLDAGYQPAFIAQVLSDNFEKKFSDVLRNIEYLKQQVSMIPSLSHFGEQQNDTCKTLF